jgi:hypothetical protein
MSDPVVISLEDSPPRPSQNSAFGYTGCKAKVPRAIVNSEHLCVLVASYHRHFAVYSKTRSNVSQLLPKLVWQPVYMEYKTQFPDSPFVEDSLQERLKETLRELKTGTANDEGGEKATNQNEEVMMRLKTTRGHARRNVLKMRADLCNGVPVKNECEDTELPTKENATASTGAKRPLFRPKGKSLEIQARGIEIIAESLQASQVHREKLLKIQAQKQEIENLQMINLEEM